jgi:hypothetical protein
MPLTAEDELRLNVLMTQAVQAVRIDEPRLMLHALTASGEARVTLHPDTRPDRYLRQVREFLSGAVLGSPGGYPLYIRRWTRMGQMRDDSLEPLLKLGEPEAIVAVVHAHGLTPELARRAWWAMPVSENARRMLEKPTVAQSVLGPVLASHLVEHLAFEDAPRVQMETVRLVLQPGLIGAGERARLWEAARKKTACLMGFMQALPDALPDAAAPHPALAAAQAAAAEQPAAQPLARAWSAPGQAWLASALEVLARPGHPDVAVALFEALGGYFRAAETLPELRGVTPGGTAACRELAGCGEARLTPILAQTNAEGTLLKRKLTPVVAPVEAALRALLA